MGRGVLEHAGRAVVAGASEGGCMLTSLLLLHSLTAAVASDPPVRVWFNSDGHYEFGDRAKVYAQAAQDGYLVVLRADAQGHVRVLFPIDPDGNQQIRGDKKDELKGRGGREAFVVDDTSGHGTVLAAVAKTPFQFDEFAKNGVFATAARDRKSTRLNSSHSQISYAVFCLKKKKQKQ